MNKIIVNGKAYEVGSGKSISVINGVVMVDGKQVGDEVSGVVEIKFEGDLASLKTDANVTCKNVNGGIEAGGNVSCDNVVGTIDAGGNVSCDDVSGDIDAGGNVQCDSAKAVKGGGTVAIGSMNINA